MVLKRKVLEEIASIEMQHAVMWEPSVLTFCTEGGCLVGAVRKDILLVTINIGGAVAIFRVCDQTFSKEERFFKKLVYCS